MENHDTLMWKHEHRGDTTFVPYMFRPSYGRCRYEDDGQCVRVVLDVAGLGTLVMTVVPRYNLSTGRMWNQDARITTRIEEPDGCT